LIDRRLADGMARGLTLEEAKRALDLEEMRQRARKEKKK
jgi:hypothetical protein